MRSFTPHVAANPPHLVKITLNFPQKVALQFDGNVVFSRYLATIFAAFVRVSHNAAIFSREFAPKLRVSSIAHEPDRPDHLGPSARLRT
jgi:hypothetical protein